MKKIKTVSKEAPAAIGPYSQAIQAGDFIFTSGQLPLSLVTGEIISGDIKEQTRQAMENLKNVLLAGGSDLDLAVKTTVYIKNMDDFAAINEVYGTFFEGDYPARSCVEVSALPKGALVEIEAVALIKNN